MNNFELSPDGYRGDLMNEVSKFRYTISSYRQISGLPGQPLFR